MAILIDILAAGVVDASGEPLANGLAYYYEVGTTTKTTVYQDADLSIPHPNPLTLDAAGRAIVYAAGQGRLVLEDADGNQTQDIEVVGAVASLAGDITVGTNSLNQVVLNSKIRGDLIPRLPNVFHIGNTDYTWTYLVFDNGANDGGTIYFNGDTSTYIQSNAAGTVLTAQVGANSYFSIDGDGDAVVSGTASSAQLLVNCTDTNDALISLQVNNASANRWDIRNDNSDSDILRFQYNGNSSFTLSTSGTGTFGDDLVVGATDKIYLDGGSNTYITETAADVFRVYCGGTSSLIVTPTYTAVQQDLYVGTTDKLYFDGGSDTYIAETASDILSFYAGAVACAYVSEAGGVGVLGATERFYLLSPGTTATAANLNIAGTGQVREVVSSRQFKKNISDLDWDTSVLYDFRPVKFESNNEDEVGQTFMGFIAEEIDELFPSLVIRDTKGQPRSLAYDRITVLLVSEIKKLRDRIVALEGQIGMGHGE